MEIEGRGRGVWNNEEANRYNFIDQDWCEMNKGASAGPFVV